jgi:hypothetical protein
VTRLTREVEEVVLVANEVPQAVFVTHIRDVHGDRILDSGDVEEIAAVFVDQRIDEHDLRSRLDQFPGEVRADETEPAGDEDASPVEGRR